MKRILIIDTSSAKEVKVGLRLDESEDIVVREIGRDRAQAVLPIMHELLIKHGFTVTDLTGIEVNTGPGSFTGLRVGVAIANTLGHSLLIPINDGKPGASVEPQYN